MAGGRPRFGSKARSSESLGMEEEEEEEEEEEKYSLAVTTNL